jgi:prophage antirepressor-like protein
MGICIDMEIENVFTNNAIIKTFNAHNVEILGTLEEPLFRAADIGLLLEMTNIRKTLTSFDKGERVVTRAYTRGGAQEVTMLTEQGLYKLLMISRKPIAKQFQKWIFSVIKEIRLNGKYDHDKQVEEFNAKLETLQQQNMKLAKNITVGECLKKSHEDIIRHNCLIEAHIGKYCVYIAKVLDLENDQYIVKIGSTYAINTRKYDLNAKFIEVLFLDVFPCDHNYVKFEKMLQNHETVRRHFYSVAKSTETFKISKTFSYDTLLRIAKQMHINFVGVTSEDIREDRRVELRKQEMDFGRELLEKTNEIDIFEMYKSFINLQSEIANIAGKHKAISTQNEDLKKLIHTLIDKVDALEKNDNNKSQPQPQQTYQPTHEIVPINNPRGPKVQIYDENGVYQKTFASYMDAVRIIDGASRTTIGICAKDKTLYKGYRWHLIEPGEDDTPKDIGETVEKKIIRKGLIAMLNLGKTEIVKVFADQKTASHARQMSSGAAICKAIKEKTQSSGHFGIGKIVATTCETTISNITFCPSRPKLLAVSRSTNSMSRRETL